MARILASYTKQSNLTLHVWNSFETIEGSIKDCLGPRYVIGETTLIYRKYKHEKISKNKEDNDVWILDNNEYSLEFTFDWNIKMKGFP